MTRKLLSNALALTAIASVLAACATTQAPMYDQSALPDAVKVPAGNKVAMETVGVGEITYECRDKKDAAGQYEWAFVGPDLLSIENYRHSMPNRTAKLTKMVEAVAEEVGVSLR